MTAQALRDIDALGTSSTAASIGSVLSSFVLHPEWQGIAYMIASLSGLVAISLGIVRIYYTVKNKGRSGE